MFNQRVGRALDRAFPAQGAQRPTDERGLAAAQIAGQCHDHSAVERPSEPRTERRRGRGIAQMQMDAPIHG